MDYRAYIIGEHGHFIGVHEIDAPDDNAALEKAKQYQDGLDIEVWQQGRRIARLAGSKRKR
jgi:hypothetical protein